MRARGVGGQHCGVTEANPSDGSVTPPPEPAARAMSWRAWARRIAGLAVGLVIMYFALPLLAASLSKFPEVTTVALPWLFLVVACESASFVMVWMMLRLALGTRRWVPVATAQLAGNALSSAVPGGAAAGAALQLRMLGEAGIDPTKAASGMTVFVLLQFATLGALPLLMLPLLLAGAAFPGPLRRVIVIGIVVFVVAALLALVFLGFDKPLLAFGRLLQMFWRRARNLPQRLLEERNQVRRALGKRWKEAALVSVGRIGFDYLALVAAVGSVGAHARPSLILIAYFSATLLALIPLTPGGLGFVEAGLAGLLTVAGVDGAHAVLATLIYRLAAYWLPLLAGPFAYVVARVMRARAEEAERS